MLKCLECLDVKKLGICAGGVFLGTAGNKFLASQDAKKFYVNCGAAGLRGKECVMPRGASVQENGDDILAEAQEKNRRREEEVVEDESEE